MPVVRRSPVLRSLVAAASATVLLPLLVPMAAASAQESVAAGDTVVGDLVRVWAEPGSHHEAAEEVHAEPLTWIEPDTGEAVRVPTEAVEQIPVGSSVEVTLGEEVVDAASADEGVEHAREVLAAEVLQPAPAEGDITAEAATGITNEVTVAMVVPKGGAQDGTTLDQVVQAVDGPVAQFWSDVSRGAISLGVGVTAQHDWSATVAPGSTTTDAPCSDYMALFEEVADRVGFAAGPGKHLLLYVASKPSKLSGCYDGLAEVGTGLGGGGRLYVRSTATSLIAHELGHNFSLGHSSEIQCDDRVDTGSCQVTPYNDWYDLMGFSWQEMGSLNAPHADRLGLLPAAERVAVSTWSPASSYTLVPVSAPSGLRAVQLTDPFGVRYWLEYRQAGGQDAWLGTSANRPALDQGVTLRKGSGLPDTSLLLDGTPSSTTDFATDRQVALPLGRRISVHGGDFTVTVDSVAPEGAVVRISPGATPVGVKYAALGGPQGALGVPIRTELCGLPDGGCFRAYRNGSIYWSKASGARQVATGVIRNRWSDLGGERGLLGYPVSDTACGLVDGGCYQHFQRGSLYHSPASGTFFVRAAIRARWAAAGWEKGPLGYPVTDERCGLVDGGCFQHFRGGSIYWSSATGARLVTGLQRSRWAALGWERGLLGYPVSDTACGLPEGGCFQHFQGGSVYSSTTTGARVVTGPQRSRWASLGWERGLLGYPVSDTACGLVDGGCYQHFQRGSLYHSPASGTSFVRAAIRARWAAAGWETGPLRYPVTDERCGLVGGGCFQHFQGGSIYWSPATGARLMSGPIRDAWAAAGWERGTLGYPVGNPRAVSGGQAQDFQGGTLTYLTRTGQVRRS